MTANGAGIAPLGVGPYGVGTPDQAPVPGGMIFKDTYTSSQFTGRYVDPRSRRYQFDSFGRVVGQRSVPQLVYLAWGTEYGSSSVSTLGNRIRSIQTIGAAFDQQVTQLVAAAVSHLTSSQLMKIVSIDIQRQNSSGVFIHVRWKDLTTDIEHTSEL